MNTRGYNGYCPKAQTEPTLEELKERVTKINEACKCINGSELSIEMTTLAIKELQEKKAELITLMHQMIDEL